MKKLTLIILIFVLAHSYITAQVVTNVVPLKPGNKWVYYSEVLFQGARKKYEVTDSVKIINGIPFYHVLGDGYSTILSNGFYARFSDIMKDSLYKYFKINPQINDAWDQPELIDTLYSAIVDTFSAPVFGEYILIYAIDRYEGALSLSREYWSKEFGMLNGLYEQAEDFLLGCVIDGVVYGDTLTVVIDEEEELPSEFVLYQNYPNPFNSNTVISWQLESSCRVELKIFDLLGREIETLINQYYAPGKYNIIFHAKNLPSGAYFYRIITDDFSTMNKMIYLK